MSDSDISAFIYVALPCEAKPLIDFYKLKKDRDCKAFASFRNEEMVLTITGVGKVAMAAAIGYSQALFGRRDNAVALNIGIAGHGVQPVGSLFLIAKITDSDNGRCYYPPLVFSPVCKTAEIITFARPQTCYPESALCDMEASAFYESACRFGSGELVQCLKIVSDNAATLVAEIQPKFVSNLIASHLPVIDQKLTQLKLLARKIDKPNLAEFNEIIQRYRFTAYEEIELKKLLMRGRQLTDESLMAVVAETAKTSKDFLKLSQQHLDSLEFKL